MRSLMFLESALLEENVEDVKGFLSEIDRKTANAAFKLIGEHFGLTTMEIDGIHYAHLASTSQIMGYSDPSGLAKLMDAYQIMTPKIGWYGVEVRTRIREVFKLDEKDSKAAFIPYEGILVAGMMGTTPGAKKIKTYLLKAEQIARIGVAMAVDQFKLEIFKLRRCEKIVTMANTIAKMDNTIFRDTAIEHFEQLTGKTFPKSRQKRLFQEI